MIGIEMILWYLLRADGWFCYSIVDSGEWIVESELERRIGFGKLLFGWLILLVGIYNIGVITGNTAKEIQTIAETIPYPRSSTVICKPACGRQAVNPQQITAIDSRSSANALTRAHESPPAYPCRLQSQNPRFP